MAIDGATVTIGSESKITDENGKAYFDLEYGDYQVSVSKEGYITDSKSFTFDSTHIICTIDINEDVESGNISFNVKSHLNEILVGATMTIKASQDGEPLQTVITDENGEGVFENLTIGQTYYVDGISSDETLYNNNMSILVSSSVQTGNFVLHP